MRAVVLVVALALFALQARPDLCSHADSVADFDGLHFVTHFDGLANDLVTDTDWERTVAPSTVNGVYIGAADATALYTDVDVVVVELLGLELWSVVNGC